MDIIIRDTCVKCGACVQINEAIFEMHNDGATVNHDKIDKSEDDCYDAVFICPVDAIMIV